MNGKRQGLGRTVWEIVLILLLSLFLALIYNAASPSGLRILPKKAKTGQQTGAALIQNVPAPPPWHFSWQQSPPEESLT